MSAREKLLEQFEVLTPRLQAAARFIVDYPNEVVINSMRSLAEKAGAQPATLVRLAQQLGYDGWSELKSAFAEDLGLHDDTYGQRAKTVTMRGRTHDLVSELFAVHRGNLDVTEKGSGSQLRETAKALKKAKCVHIAGLRASFPIAYTLFYGYRLFRNSVALIDGSGAGLELQLRPIERGDAVIVASFAPYSRESLVIANHARQVGAALIAITDSSASPLALQANQTLLFAVHSPSFFPSVAAGVALSEALLEQLVAESGSQVVDQIERVERQLFESGAYVQSSAKRSRS
jgi:DNA-binding MurR/RpiR family transcriptional regulator